MNQIFPPLTDAILQLADARARHSLLMQRLSMTERAICTGPTEQEAQVADLEANIAMLRRRIAGLSERLACLPPEPAVGSPG